MLIGFFGFFKLSNTIYLNPEINYSSEGVNNQGLTFTNNYLDIPILMNFRISQKSYLELGPEFGFLASNKVKVDGEKFDGGYFGQNMNLSVALGFKTFINDRFGFGIRYNLGIKNIGKDFIITQISNTFSPNPQVSIVDSDPKAFSRVWQISISYSIGDL